MDKYSLTDMSYPAGRASVRHGRQARARHRPAAARRRSAYLFVLTAHFVVAGSNALAAVLFPSALWAYAALAIFISLSFGILKTSPATFLFCLPLLALRITEFISGAAIESGAFMTETQTIGHPTGAFSRLLLVYILFFGVIAALVEAFWPRLRLAFRAARQLWETHAAFIWKGLLVSAILCSLLLLWTGLQHGFPLLAGIDRFSYERRVDSPLYGAFIRNRLVLVPFIGPLLALPRYRTRAAGLTVWLLAASILFGEKFTSLVLIVSMVGIPAVLVHIAHDRPIPVRSLAMGSAIITALTIPAVLLAYGAASDLDLAMQRYADRTALQGQLWYQTDKAFARPIAFDKPTLAADVATWFTPSAQDPSIARTDFGRYYVMKQFTSWEYMLGLMKLNSGFVFSLYPYMMMTTGVSGMIAASTFLALYHALLLLFLSQALARANWIAALLLGRAVNSLYATYADGYLWNIFGIKTLGTIGVALLFLWELQRRDSILRAIARTAGGRKPPRAPRRVHRIPAPGRP